MGTEELERKLHPYVATIEFIDNFLKHDNLYHGFTPAQSRALSVDLVELIVAGEVPGLKPAPPFVLVDIHEN